MKTTHTLELQIEYIQGLREDLTGVWFDENLHVIDSAIATLQSLLPTHTCDECGAEEVHAETWGGGNRFDYLCRVCGPMHEGFTTQDTP